MAMEFYERMKALEKRINEVAERIKELEEEVKRQKECKIESPEVQ